MAAQGGQDNKGSAGQGGVMQITQSRAGQLKARKVVVSLRRETLEKARQGKASKAAQVKI